MTNLSNGRNKKSVTFNEKVDWSATPENYGAKKYLSLKQFQLRRVRPQEKANLDSAFMTTPTPPRSTFNHPTSGSRESSGPRGGT